MLAEKAFEPLLGEVVELLERFAKTPFLVRDHASLHGFELRSGGCCRLNLEADGKTSRSEVVSDTSSHERKDTRTAGLSGPECHDARPMGLDEFVKVRRCSMEKSNSCKRCPPRGGGL